MNWLQQLTNYKNYLIKLKISEGRKFNKPRGGHLIIILGLS